MAREMTFTEKSYEYTGGKFDIVLNAKNTMID